VDGRYKRIGGKRKKKKKRKEAMSHTWRGSGDNQKSKMRQLEGPLKMWREEEKEKR